MSEEFFKVSQINQFIKDVLNSGFPQALWICGEIQGYDRNKDKKHVFFELVEKDPNSNEIVARIGLVIFANKKMQIDAILKRSENAFSLKDDIEVKFSCKVDFYAPHGAVRLVVENIDPVYTLGKIAQEKQKLIAALRQKGVLEQNKKLELPLVSLNIGLITAYDSAAYNDFISELKRSDFGFKVYLRNCLMQGVNAERDVCSSIAELNKLKSLDVIVITRGGGSIAELSCFDSEKIALAIAASQLPVLSGIGHEINTTITDLAAHTYAKTPTAIAQFLVENIQEFIQSLENNFQRITDLTQRQIDLENRRVKEAAFNLQQHTHQFLKEHNKYLIKVTETIQHRSLGILQDQKKDLKNMRVDLKKIVITRFQRDQLKLKSYVKIVDMAHPVNTMKRGFSITKTNSGRLVRNIADLKSGEIIQTELIDGDVISKVTETKKIKRKG